MNLSKRVQRRLFESLDPAVDSTTAQYVYDLYHSIIDKYINRFLSTANSAEELYNEYNDNNLPGGLDFILMGCLGDKDDNFRSGHTFGASASPDLDGFLDVKKGCWLNSLDFMNKYSNGFEEYSLAHGIMIANSDLEAAEKSLENDKIPLRIPMIMHGFIVDVNGNVFDPTLGVNEKYHYFWNTVPKDIWQGFDYKFKDEGDWEVKDFAAYTQSTIKSYRGNGFKGMFPERS